MADPLSSASTLMGGDVHKLEGIANLSLGLLFILIVGFVVVVVVVVVVVTLQVAIRAVELIIYMIGPPLVAPGQLSPDGGVW